MQPALADRQAHKKKVTTTHDWSARAARPRIYIYIYICVYMYMYIEKATASAADLWDPRLGCLDAWMLVFLLAWC